MKPETISVKNTITATDVTLNNRILDVAATVNDRFIPMDYLKIISDNGGILPYLTESVQVEQVAYTAAVNTTFSIYLSQQIGEKFIEGEIGVPTMTGSLSSDAFIAQAFADIVADRGFEITVTGAGTPITLTANAGYPLFNITARQNTTVTSSMLSINIVSSTNTSPIEVTVASTAGLAEGMTVDIAGHATNTAANGRWRVITLTGTTFELEGSTGNGVGGATGTVTLVAQKARGQGDDLIAAGVTDAISGDTYAKVTFDYGEAISPLMNISRDDVNKQTLWINQDAANYAAFATRFGELLQNYVPGGTTANPESAAVN